MSNEYEKCSLKLYISKEAYVEQLPDLNHYNYSNHFLKLKKTLYSLKQTLRAWYEKFKIFLLENGFKVGNIDIVFFFNYNKEEEYTYYSNIC